MSKLIYFIVLLLACLIACKESQVENSSSNKPVLETKQKAFDHSDINGDSKKITALSEITPEINKKNKITSEQLVDESKKVANSPILDRAVKVQKSPSNQNPGITFEAPNYDFGRIVQGEKIEHKFTFVNDGNEILEIKNAVASCGCTMPVFPFLGIDPGKEGNILVQFNSEGRLGSQNPSVMVYTNIRTKPFELRLTGEVITEKYFDSLSRKQK